MDPSQLNWLSASDAARGIHDGAFTAEQLMQACLSRVREVEPQVQAWTFLDEKHALSQARARDLDRAEGNPTGLLHGVPVGIKDIIDTCDMPTEDGTVLRQDIYLMSAKLRFVRCTDEPMLELAHQLLDLYTVATLAPTKISP